MRIVRDWCPEVAAGLMQGKVDVAILRRETQSTGLAFKFLVKEPLIALMPATHRLAARKTVRPRELAREIFIGPAQLAPVLKSVINAYAATIGIALQHKYAFSSLAISLSRTALTRSP